MTQRRKKVSIVNGLDDSRHGNVEINFDHGGTGRIQQDTRTVYTEPNQISTSLLFKLSFPKKQDNAKIKGLCLPLNKILIQMFNHTKSLLSVKKESD